MTAPMTAAEYRANCDTTEGFVVRTLAALEEREALLGERETLKSDASVGALVRRILDHPAATRGHSAFVYTHNGTWTTAWTEKGLQTTLSHLDSLLPKEPEVVTGPSGRSYRVKDGGVETRWSDGTSDYWMKLSPWSAVVAQDAPVVAKLLGGKDE